LKLIETASEKIVKANNNLRVDIFAGFDGEIQLYDGS